jgi:hypothetical protein
MGCLGVGEAARGGQLIANQGQECGWVFAPRAKEAGSPSKYKKVLDHVRGKIKQGRGRQGDRLTKNHRFCVIHLCVYMSVYVICE